MPLDLSLVIPAYNEAQRLPPFLSSVRRHLDARYPQRHEVIVVDDGSQDALPALLQSPPPGWPRLTVIRHETNRGKGAAVRTGMLAARGQRLLFADADGATPIEEEMKLAEAIHAGADCAVGSRLVGQAGVARQRRWSRALLGRLFAFVARRWLGIAVRDTQCGFKMFRHDAGHTLFAQSRESGYLFDLELLLLAQRLHYRVVEVPVNWREIAGGHLHLVTELTHVLPGLWRLKRRMAPLQRAPRRSHPPAKCRPS